MGEIQIHIYTQQMHTARQAQMGREREREKRDE
jgi:hypothetical protein